MLSQDKYIVAQRFGFGVSEIEIQQFKKMSAKDWARQQLRLSGQEWYSTDPILPTKERITKLHNLEQRQAKRRLSQSYYQQDAIRRTRGAISSSAPLLERLTFFWSNHFTVCADRPETIGFCGAYENEAIRPYILGTFPDMLKAVIRHPAMLLYLDNARSFGPKSLTGRKTGKGLNENLAREILELHTVGVDGGYQQQDIIEFAKVLTGWTTNRFMQFHFDGYRHEPGQKQILGHVFQDNGRLEGEQVLEMLALHPSTARFLARKLCQHFFSDTPPAALINRIATLYLHHKGNLRPVYLELLEAEEAFSPQFDKFKTPNEYVISVLRTAGLDLDASQGIHTLESLGQEPYKAGSPAGWADRAEAWSSGDQLNRRIEWARSLVGLISKHQTVTDFWELAIGPVSSSRTAFLVKNAPTKEDAFALILISPEFQRR